MKKWINNRCSIEFQLGSKSVFNFIVDSSSFLRAKNNLTMAKNGLMRRAFHKVFRSPKNCETKEIRSPLVENVLSSDFNIDQQARDDESTQGRGCNDSVYVEALVVNTQEIVEENTVDHDASTPLARSCSAPATGRRSGVPISVDHFIPKSPEPNTETFDTFPSEASPISVMESLNDSPPRQSSTTSESIGSRRMAVTHKISEICEEDLNEVTESNLPITAQGLNAPERWWDSSWDPLRYSDDYSAGAAINRLLSLQKEREKRGETSNPAFLEKKKNNEKNEFPKIVSASVNQSAQAAQLQVQVKDSGSHDSFEKLTEAQEITEKKPLSQDSQEKPSQAPEEWYSTPHKNIQVTRSVSPEATNDDSEDNNISLACIESRSSSYDSLDALDSGTFYSEMESIGDITIDAETTRLVNAHKMYKASEKPTKRGCLRYKYQVNSDDDISIFTEKRKKLTWYDDETNCRKPFTLKTDESFDYSLDSKSTMAPSVMTDHIWPLAASIGGFLDKLNCSGTELRLDEVVGDLTKPK
mmetsp:Transcript_17363/g.36400  ORF Transcript_17363/g.36400 Transcript_17363/m.36400 type:complete len:528 (+) Transcript_17363:82-1665(+)